MALPVRRWKSCRVGGLNSAVSGVHQNVNNTNLPTPDIVFYRGRIVSHSQGSSPGGVSKLEVQIVPQPLQVPRGSLSFGL